MKIAAIQMVSTPDVAQNLETAARLLAQAAVAGARMAVLPEYFCLMGQRDTDKLAIAEVPGQGPIQHCLAEQAKALGLWIVGGTMPVRIEGSSDRVRNTCWVFGPDGTCAGRYDKIHLFAFHNGREHYDEATVLQPGQEPVSVKMLGHRVGLSICYDLRFPELYRALTLDDGRGPCDLLCVPAAFTYTTGRAHWELLLRARAVENQCYVIAAAQGGIHATGRRTWGHSLIIDPWGEILDCCEEGEGFAMAQIDDQRLQQVRMQLPALAHRRL